MPALFYIVVCISLCGLVSFFAVFTYLDHRALAEETQLAAAAHTDPFASLVIEAQAAFVVDLKSGRVLYQKNPDVQLPLASITKVPLALVVAGELTTDSIVTIPFDTAPAGSRERLARGEKWRVGDIITFTLVSSSNDGAKILAYAANAAVRNHSPEAPKGEHGDEATIWQMNNLARKLGLTETYFLNSSGLDISTTQSGAYGSARDVAHIFAYAASSSPDLFSGTTRDGLLLSDENGHTTRASNTNEALGEIPGLIMGKTGFTDLAGGNLAVVFDVGLARPVVAVVLGSGYEGRFSDMEKIVSRTREAIAQE